MRPRAAIAALLVAAAGCATTPLPTPLARSTAIVPRGHLQVSALVGLQGATSGAAGLPVVVAARTGLAPHLDGTLRLWLEGASIDLGWQIVSHDGAQIVLAPSLAVSNTVGGYCAGFECAAGTFTPAAALEVPVLFGFGSGRDRLVLAPHVSLAYAWSWTSPALFNLAGKVLPPGLQTEVGLDFVWNVALGRAAHLILNFAGGFVPRAGAGWIGFSLGLSVP